jgi:hypothetical protein
MPNRPRYIRGMALRALGATLPRLTRTALAKRGGGFAAIVTEWAQIVGPELAAASVPERLTASTGVLALRVEGAAAVELQHLAPLLIERINTFLGRPAVTRLKLVRAPLPNAAPAPPPEPAPAPPDVAAGIARAAAEIADPALAASLERFGLTLARSVAGGLARRGRSG